MSSPTELLRIVDSLFDPKSNERTIYYLSPRGESRLLYKVWLFLDGPSLPFVNKVTYTLHPTFPDPERSVVRSISNPNCQLVFWAWGVFTVQAIVEDKQGKLTRLDHYLTFGTQITEAKKDGSGVRFVEMNQSA